MSEEYTKGDWPCGDNLIIGNESNLPLGLLSAADYERARLAVAYVEGLTTETLRNVLAHRRKMATEALKGVKYHPEDVT